LVLSSGSVRLNVCRQCFELPVTLGEPGFQGFQLLLKLNSQLVSRLVSGTQFTVDTLDLLFRLSQGFTR
jgi:hypothetical protein